MKTRTNVFVGALVFTTMFPFASAHAESAKATVQVGNVNMFSGSSDQYVPIMKSEIRTANQKDLIMDVSLECGLLTRTRVSSKLGISDTASAQASVKVRVLVDGKEAKPGEVVFCKRSQELTATFGGILNSCQDSNLNGIIEAAECDFNNEELELVLDTMNANSFNFILDNMASGIHKIEVQAKLDSGTQQQLGSADARASIGKGSIAVEEVRLIKDQTIDF